MSKNTIKLMATAMFVASVFTAPTHAADQNALNTSFFNNNISNHTIPNCMLRKEYNYFMNQWTTNEACAPMVTEIAVNRPTASVGSQVQYGGGSYSVPSYSYSAPVYYSAPTTYYLPSSSKGYSGSSCYYCGSNSGYGSGPTFWNTPSNSWDYMSDSMFDKYYAGGYGSDKGFYQPNDSVVYDDFDGLEGDDLYGSRDYDFATGYGTVQDVEWVNSDPDYQRGDRLEMDDYDMYEFQD